MTLSEKLIDLRRKAGLSQEQMAQRLDVSRQAVSKWETGESLPDTGKLLAISRLLGVTADYLLDDRQSEPDASPAAAPKLRPAARIWRQYGFITGYLLALLGGVRLTRLVISAVSSLRMLDSFNGLNPDYLAGSGLDVLNRFTGPFTSAAVAALIADGILYTAIIVGGLLLARYLRRKYRAA